ncbi:hypothetical protein OIE66_32835 [Nonomuraea sp. NBC_01738]|uniref:hypothetical protein n=1 Tax=Nonomuraea sp. NBC_01738 TaxID=2976003 RepID=UPI002E11A3A9|nr:hypothetical protein OIE66_32835 [Nonomuraea sp. NBC_01738]
MRSPVAEPIIIGAFALLLTFMAALALVQVFTATNAPPSPAPTGDLLFTPTPTPAATPFQAPLPTPDAGGTIPFPGSIESGSAGAP